MNTFKMIAASVAFAALGTVSQAATLTGDDVTLDVAEIGYSSTTTVGAGDEFTIGAISMDVDATPGDELMISSTADLAGLGVTTFELSDLDFSGGEILVGFVVTFSQLANVVVTFTQDSLKITFDDGAITEGVVLEGMLVTTSLDTPAVPLPAGLPLVASGLALLGFMGRRKKA